MTAAAPTTGAPTTVAPSFGELVTTSARIGVLSFGGAAGQIAMMHTVVVDEKKWLTETAFQHALNYCMLLPGPEAQQLATYIGWMTHGVRGGLVAGGLFVVPGAIVMMGLAALYVLASGLAVVEGLFFGIKAAVLAIVAHALLKIASRGLKTPTLYALAGLAFALILLVNAPFPLIVIGAGVVGAALASARPELVGARAAGGPAEPIPAGRTRGALLAAAACLAAWWAPVALSALALGGGHLVTQVGLFFSKLAVVTFGGAYALLAYLSQSAVDMGWVTDREMIDGLGLAETTPGPTILVNQFVAFLAGWRAPEPLGAGPTAALAATMAVWVTFAPSFLWIFAGAPYLERLRRSPRAAGALAGITAAVVGVIAYLALWFGLNVLFREVGTVALGPIRLPAPVLASLDLAALALTLTAFAVMFVWHRGVMTTVGLLGAAGVAMRLAGL
jgi:chromate transporter